MKKSDSPIYLQIRDRILFEIGQYYQLDDKLPTEAEYVDKFKVHRGTVRKALDMLVNEGVVVKRQGSGAFIAKKELATKNKTSSAPATVGICYHENCEDIFLTPFYGKIISSFLQESQGEFSLTAFETDGSIDSLDRIRSKRRKSDLIALIVLGASLTEEFVSRLENLDLNIILIDACFDTACVNSIGTDNIGGALSAIEHLTKLGHRRIAMLTGAANDQSSRRRFQGYQLGLLESGIDYDPSLIERPSLINVQGGYEAAMRLISRGRSFSSIFCHNDQVAIGAMKALKESGTNVPEDVSVVGFDDIDMAALTNPPLTTVKVDVQQMAQFALQRLKTKRLNRNSKGGGILLRTNLIVRNSTIKAKGVDS